MAACSLVGRRGRLPGVFLQERVMALLRAFSGWTGNGGRRHMPRRFRQRVHQISAGLCAPLLAGSQFLVPVAVGAGAAAVAAGHRLCLQVLSKEPEDHHAVAVPRHDGTPDNTGNLVQAEQPRLNAKVRHERGEGLYVG
jgi:hypothetical protein